MAARDNGRFKEATRLLEKAQGLPAWRDMTQRATECAARKILSHYPSSSQHELSDFYWDHYQYAQCVGQVEETHGSAVTPSSDATHAQIQALSQATKLKPDWALAYNDMGLRFGYWHERGKLQEAVALLSHAVALDPASGIYATNLAMAYQHVGHLAKAAQFSRKAAALLPDNAQVQLQLGRALEDIEDHKGALGGYAAAHALDPSDHDALCAKIFLSHYLCAWKGWKANLETLQRVLRGPVLQRHGWGGACDQPFRLFSYSLPADVAPLLTAHVIAKEAAAILPQHILTHAKLALHTLPNGARQLNVAYMSSDFGSHTVSSLLGGLLRKHDRTRYTLTALELKTAGDIHQHKVRAGLSRTQLRDSFQHWVDLSDLDDASAAASIQTRRVHILVDLNGHSKGGRQGVLLRRPAPVSLTFLGYPATSGGSVDVIVTDRYAAPPELRANLYEGQLMMPNSYFVNDYRHRHPRPLAAARDDDAQVACGRQRCFTDADDAPHGGAVLANFGQVRWKEGW